MNSETMTLVNYKAALGVDFLNLKEDDRNPNIRVQFMKDRKLIVKTSVHTLKKMVEGPDTFRIVIKQDTTPSGWVINEIYPDGSLPTSIRI